MTKKPSPEPTAEPPDLTERLVNHLAELQGGAKTRDLAASLVVPVLDIRHELVDLERLGIVYRTGRTRGTRWWLG